MQQPQASAGILSLATYITRYYHDADYIAAHSNTPADVIRNKIGWTQKNVPGPGDHTVEMSLKASRKALYFSGLKPEDIDLVIWSGEEYREYRSWPVGPKLQKELGLTYLFIAHDLSMVRHISDRVGVMYLGKIVELADRNDLYNHALHPYTQALLSAVPVPDPLVEEKRKRIILSGEMPSPSNPPKGCPFHPRCPVKMDICSVEVPVWRQVVPGHWAACHKV